MKVIGTVPNNDGEVSQPLVSIVMPAYNAEAFVGDAIRSILVQTYQNWELLVADDASTDSSRAIINSFTDSRIKAFHNSENKGYLLTCNKLFGQAKGEFLTFQDADDLSEPARLERQIQTLQADPELAMLGTWANLIDARGSKTGIDRRPTLYEDILALQFKRNCFCGATIMIRREIFAIVGGYREFFCSFGAEDYDWAFRIAERFRCENIPLTLYSYRIHSGSISRAPDYRRAISHQIVINLAKQRASTGGRDDLTEGRLDSLNELVTSLTLPYRLDPSLIHRDLAGLYMYAGQGDEALRACLSAIATRPAKLVNWRTLFYCARKLLIGFLAKFLNRASPGQ